MNTEQIIITIFAQDRPGVVQQLSDVVLEHQGSWLESSLSRLCGQFAGIVHLSVASNAKDDLLKGLGDLGDVGIHVIVQDATSIEHIEAGGTLEIIVEANDRPGIVEEITSTLAANHVNVEQMETECESASMAGYELFRAHLFVSLPDGYSEDQLEVSLENVSDDLMVTIVSND